MNINYSTLKTEIFSLALNVFNVTDVVHPSVSVSLNHHAIYFLFSHYDKMKLWAHFPVSGLGYVK